MSTHTSLHPASMRPDASRPKPLQTCTLFAPTARHHNMTQASMAQGMHWDWLQTRSHPMRIPVRRGTCAELTSAAHGPSSADKFQSSTARPPARVETMALPRAKARATAEASTQRHVGVAGIAVSGVEGPPRSEEQASSEQRAMGQEASDNRTSGRTGRDEGEATSLVATPGHGLAASQDAGRAVLPGARHADGRADSGSARGNPEASSSRDAFVASGDAPGPHQPARQSAPPKARTPGTAASTSQRRSFSPEDPTDKQPFHSDGDLQTTPSMFEGLAPPPQPAPKPKSNFKAPPARLYEDPWDTW